MPKVVRLTSKRQQSEREAAARAAEQLSLLSDDLMQQLPGEVRIAISRVAHALQKHTRPDTEEGLWPGGYSMLSRAQTKAVWDAIRALPADERPGHVRHAFDLIVLNLRQDTGEVMLTRDQFAEEIGCNPNHVSNVMATLERMGVIRRERRKVVGMRGPGMAVYFINPHVAWNGSLDERKTQAKETRAPFQLELLQGGAR